MNVAPAITCFCAARTIVVLAGLSGLTSRLLYTLLSVHRARWRSVRCGPWALDFRHGATLSGCT